MKKTSLLLFLAAAASCSPNQIHFEDHGAYTLAIQSKGPVLGYSSVPTFQKAESASLTEKQRRFLGDDRVRHILVSDIASPGGGAAWANNVQAFCEAAPFGIPANNSTDPRNYTNGQVNTSTYNHEPDGEFNPDGTCSISRWPREIGLGTPSYNDVATVGSNGKVVAVSEGTAVITAEAGGKTATCTVTVTPVDKTNSGTIDNL